MPATNNKLISPRLSHPWTSRKSTQEATLLRSLLFSLQMQILLKRSHRLEMAAEAKQQHLTRARAIKIINIINETRTAPEKVDRKAREAITIRVDMVVTVVEAPLLQTRELVVEWAVETVGMAT